MTSAPGRARGALVALAVAALLYAVSWNLGENLRQVRAAVPPTEERLFVPDPRTARFMAAGYNELVADLVWARTLVYYGDGMMHGFSMKDVEPMIELVNTLDPYFRRPYAWGAYATTFRQTQPTQDEFRASIAILERGIRVFPEDWELKWMLGLRYYADLATDDPVERREYQEIGVSYIEQSMRLPGAPPDLPNLAASLRSKLGQRERALRELGEMILTMEPGKARDKLIDRFESMSSASQARELRDAGESFARQWMADLPFAPAPLYVLVGAPPPFRSAEELLELPSFLSDQGAAGDTEVDDPEAAVGSPDALPQSVP